MSFIEIKHLKLVKAISETGNMTKAAQTLFLTQPALSHQLVDLEGKLETPLFHRTKKKMILTRAGEMLLKSAENVLLEITRAEREIGKIVHPLFLLDVVLDRSEYVIVVVDDPGNTLGAHLDV